MLKQPGNSGTDDANSVIGLCGACDASLLFDKTAVVEAEIRGLGKRAAHGCIGSDGSMARSAGWLCVEPIVMFSCSP
ncbi:hypothetical protein D3C80_1651500 [compost metagenome]